MIGYEALMRPTGANPREVLAWARSKNAISAVDQCILSCIHSDTWLIPQNKYLFVNLTCESLLCLDQFLPLVSAIHQRLCIEVLEDRYDCDINALSEALEDWRAYGCLVALDDCSELSDLQAIKRLSPNFVKISARLPFNIARPIAAAGLAAGAAVVLECIDSPVYLQTARDLGATLCQGFLLGKPRFFSKGEITVVQEEHMQGDAAPGEPGGAGSNCNGLL